MTTLSNVGWRHGSSNRDCGALLARLLHDFDASGEVRTAQASPNRTLVRMHNASGSQPAIMRQERIVKTRRLPVDEENIKTAESKYACQFQLVAQEVLVKVYNKTSFNARQFFYELRVPHRSLEEEDLLRLLHDLALTINEHPCRLGLKAQTKSQVYVPVGCELKVRSVENVFEYYDHPRAIPWETLLPGKVSYIPGMISELGVAAKGQTIECVVVTEQRNIQNAFQLLKGQNALPGSGGIMVVMTGGFPDFAVREFLNLLSKNGSFFQTPFLWLSDCDAHGIFQFFMLKYGSRSTAWANTSMICPRLQYAGLTHDILTNIVRAHPQRQLEHARLSRPDMSTDEQTSLLEEFTGRAEALHTSILMAALAPRKQTGHDRRMKSIKDNAYLEFNDDQRAQSAYDALEQGQTPLSLLCVNNIDPHNVSYLIRDVVASALGRSYDSVPVINQIDSLRQDMARLDTQEQPEGLPASVGDLNMAETADEEELQAFVEAAI